VWGQWIGSIKGTNQGSIILSIDHDRPYTGRISLHDQTGDRASQIISVELNISGKNINGKLYDFIPLDDNYLPRLDLINEAWNPKSGSLSGTISNDEKIIEAWKTGIGTEGKFDFTKFEPLDKYERNAELLSWDKYKEKIQNNLNSSNKFIYRGHKNNRYTLTTSFHRTGRRDLYRFSIEDIPRIHRNISAKIGQKIDLQDQVEYGGLINLLQHHSFPTPLLDWTESPYVAAYFSYADIDKYNIPDGCIRIFEFNQSEWIKKRQPVVSINYPDLTFSLFELSVLYNPRALPQQSIQAFSNISDIEYFIDHYSNEDNVEYLKRYDISLSERDKVMSDLYMMNITSESLFPGIEGTCKTFKEKYF